MDAVDDRLCDIARGVLTVGDVGGGILVDGDTTATDTVGGTVAVDTVGEDADANDLSMMYQLLSPLLNV